MKKAERICLKKNFSGRQLKRVKMDHLKTSYTKVLNHQAGQDLVNNILT